MPIIWGGGVVVLVLGGREGCRGVLGWRETHGQGDQQADGDAGGDGYGGLPVVLRGEDVGVLEGAVGWGGQCVVSVATWDGDSLSRSAQEVPRTQKDRKTERDAYRRPGSAGSPGGWH